MKSTSDNFILAFFIILILFPILTLNFKENTISESERRYLANFPKLFDNNKSFNQNYGDELKNWCKDNFGFRKYFMKLCSITEYTVFNKAASPMVIKGKNDWLYFTGDNNIDIVKNTYPKFNEDELKEICEQQIKIKNYFASKNIEYVLLLTPSKVSIYPEYLYEGYYNPQITPMDILYDYLEKNSDIHVINPKEALLKEKSNSNHQLFYKLDSHWNSYGIYTCYLEFAKRLKELNIIHQEPEEFYLYDADTLHDPDLAIINNVYDILHETNSEIENLEEADYENELVQKISNVSPNILHCYMTENSEINGPTILAYCDSMGPLVMELLSKNIEKMVCIQTTHMDMQIAINDLVAPDCVICQIGERRLNQLLYLNDEFLEDIKSNMESDL